MWQRGGIWYLLAHQPSNPVELLIATPSNNRSKVLILHGMVNCPGRVQPFN